MEIKGPKENIRLAFYTKDFGRQIHFLYVRIRRDAIKLYIHRHHLTIITFTTQSTYQVHNSYIFSIAPVTFFITQHIYFNSTLYVQPLKFFDRLNVAKVNKHLSLNFNRQGRLYTMPHRCRLHTAHQQNTCRRTFVIQFTYHIDRQFVESDQYIMIFYITVGHSPRVYHSHTPLYNIRDSRDEHTAQ